MKELTKELKKDLTERIKGTFIYGTISPRKVIQNTPDCNWIELLKKTKWKEANDEGKPKNANTENTRFINNLKLLPHFSISTKRTTSLLSIYGIVFSDRRNVKTKFLNHYEYAPMSRQKSDFDYYVNEENLDEVFTDYSNKNMESSRKKKGNFDIVFSISNSNKNEYILCEKCEGIGEIQYNAGNYANGEPRIKTKICPICEGTGKSSFMQRIKSFEDKYFFEKEVSLKVATNISPNNEKFEFKKSTNGIEKRKAETILSLSDLCWYMPDEWLYPLQISQLYQAPNKIIIDNKNKIENELFALGDEYKVLYNSVQKDIEDKENEHSKEDINIVCVLEKHFTISPITVISVQYNDLEGLNRNINFYIWENLLWCDSREELNLWNLLLLKIKKVIS